MWGSRGSEKKGNRSGRICAEGERKLKFVEGK